MVNMTQEQTEHLNIESVIMIIVFGRAAVVLSGCERVKSAGIIICVL